MPTSRVNKSPREDLAITNTILVNPKDFHPSVKYILVNGRFIFTIRPEPQVQPNDLGTTKIHREWAQLSLHQEVAVTPFNPQASGAEIYLGGIDLEIQTFRKAQEVRQELDVDQLAEIFIKNFKDQIFAQGQVTVLERAGVDL